MARNYRLEIIEALGGQCQWHEGCDVADPDMLQVDHVNGDGARERNSYLDRPYFARTKGRTGLGHGSGGSAGTFGGTSGAYYKNMLVNIESGRYQLLCANHNVKKHALERRAKKVAV